jgi:hypothetical protein
MKTFSELVAEFEETQPQIEILESNSEESRKKYGNAIEVRLKRTVYFKLNGEVFYYHYSPYIRTFETKEIKGRLYWDSYKYVKAYRYSDDETLVPVGIDNQHYNAFESIDSAVIEAKNKINKAPLPLVDILYCFVTDVSFLREYNTLAKYLWVSGVTEIKSEEKLEELIETYQKLREEKQKLQRALGERWYKRFMNGRYEMDV